LGDGEPVGLADPAGVADEARAIALGALELDGALVVPSPSAATPATATATMPISTMTGRRLTDPMMP
jgi:hypothetical protein